MSPPFFSTTFLHDPCVSVVKNSQIVINQPRGKRHNNFILNSQSNLYICWEFILNVHSIALIIFNEFSIEFCYKINHIKKSNMCTLSNVEIRELKTLLNIQKTQQWDQSTMRYRRLVKHSWCLQKCLRYFIMIPSHPDVSESIVFCRNYIQDLFAVWHCFFKLKDKSQNVTSKHNQLFSFSRFRPSVTLSF